jgi:adenylosuccinate lyase
MSQPNPQHDTYTSPLAARNASPEMCKIWSPRHKFTTWRKIWLAVAQAQQACGLDITDEQINEMKANLEVTDEDMDNAAKYERELRHDVMAHVHAFGDRCPSAKGIIHLGCTSQDVVCNADRLAIGESLGLITLKLVRAVQSLAWQSEIHKELPVLGFTHYQAAQPTTLGKRCAGWSYDLSICEPRLRSSFNANRPRGFQGATGTQAAFLQLVQGAGKSDSSSRFNQEPGEVVNDIAHKAIAGMGWDRWGVILSSDPEGSHPWWEHSEDIPHLVTGQTYPRVVDSYVLADLASIASVLHKIATDIRLLSNRKEIDEPFGKNQIGSSAMPYKRNPMKCERICGLTRFVMNLVGNAYDTAATQWLERTLDDSSNRRLSLPEAFLALDGALDLMHTVASGLVVNEAMVRKNLMLELPFMATENILMEAVKAGGDRQDLHEKIRVHSQAAGHRVKQEGLDNDLIDRLKADPDFEAIHHMLTEDQILNPMNFIGRSVEQTERFISEVVEPLKERYKDELDSLGSADRGV